MVYISGAWGLGENIVQGNVNPDEVGYCAMLCGTILDLTDACLQWYVFKPTLKEPQFRPIIRRNLGE